MGFFLHAVALVAYFFGVFLAFASAIGRSKAAQEASVRALVAAWVLHLASLVATAASSGDFPLRNTEEYLFALAWVILSLHLGVWFRARISAVGLVLPPVAFLLALVAFLIPAPHLAVPPTQRQGWFIFHTTIATLGIASLCVSFAMAVIYLIQERAIKSKRSLRMMDAMPSLDACDRIGMQALLGGFPLLTLGIATGAVWSWMMYGSTWTGNAKPVFAVLAWIVFALLIYMRLVRGFRGRKASYVTIAGFVLGLLTVVGMAR